MARRRRAYLLNGTHAWGTALTPYGAPPCAGVLALRRFAVIVPNLCGNGVSFSPSGSATYPSVVTVDDNVHAQRRLLHHLGLNLGYVFGLAPFVAAFASPTLRRPISARWTVPTLHRQCSWIITGHSASPARIVPGAFKTSVGHTGVHNRGWLGRLTLAPWLGPNAGHRHWT